MSSSSLSSVFRFDILHSSSSCLIFLFFILLSSSLSPSLALVSAPQTNTANQSSHAAVAYFDVNWRVFGPLVPGTLGTDVGSDPLSVRPPSFFSNLEKLERYPSQLAHDGYATWTASKSAPISKSKSISMSANRSFVSDQAKVRFSTGNSNGNNNNSDSLPFNAWVVGTLALEEPLVDAAKSTFVMVACSHAAYITPRTPISPHQPPRHHCQGQYVPCPLSLSSQEYTVHMAISSGDNNDDDQFFVRFGCNIISEMKAPALVPFHSESIRPSVIQHDHRTVLAGSYASITVLNADEQEWATAGTISVTSVPKGIQLTDLSPHPPRLAPGQMRSLRLDLDIASLEPKLFAAEKALNVSIDLQYTVNGQTRHAAYSLQLEILAWPPTSYTGTFLDNDGAVRAVSLRPPAEPCRGGGCAVLFSAHASEDMDIYATQKDAWVLMPMGDGMSETKNDGVLKCLDEIREELPGVPEKLKPQYAIRRDWTLVSALDTTELGRNDALDLVTHYPDLFIAAIPISRRRMSGSQRTNGNGNIYSAQLAFADAGLRALFDSDTYTANDRYLYAENAVGVPIAARDNNNGRPGSVGKFCMAVREHEMSHALNQSMVTLDQVPNSSKGRTLNHGYTQLQPFLTASFASSTKRTLPRQFSFVTRNPANTGTKGGLQILSLSVPFQNARFHVERQDTTWVINTRNVKRMRFRAINGIYPRPSRLDIDGLEGITVPRSIRDYNGTSEAFLDVCAEYINSNDDSTYGYTGLKWKLCTTAEAKITADKDISLQRIIENAGPLTQILGGRRVAVIYPAERKDLLALATRYANVLHAVGMAVSVTADTAAVSLLEQGAHNVVVLGGSAENEAAKALEKISKRTTVTTASNKGQVEIEICIGARCTRKKGAGVAYLTPGRFSTLGVVVAGTDGEGLKAAAAFLPVSPRQKLPEWILINARDGNSAFAGIEAAGYWSNEWKYEPALSYPPYWTATAPRSSSLVVAQADAVMSRTRTRYTLGVLGIATLILLGWILARRFRWFKNAAGKSGGYERFAFMLDEMEHECES